MLRFETDDSGKKNPVSVFKYLQIPKSQQTLTCNSILRHGLEFNCTVGKFLWPWRVVPHRLQCIWQFYNSIILLVLAHLICQICRNIHISTICHRHLVQNVIRKIYLNPFSVASVLQRLKLMTFCKMLTLSPLNHLAKITDYTFRLRNSEW